MRALAGLLCIVAHAWTVTANVEKTIFLGPPPDTLLNVRPSLDTLRLDTLDPTHAPILVTQLPVRFPSESAPRGLESWYLLRGLDHGRRYEVRICWPATQPTDFWLQTFTITKVLDTPGLISSLADYSELLRTLDLDTQAPPPGDAASPESILFLRIQAAASYYSTDRTLMENPPPVDVDIILDPFILNILPRTLGPTAIYIAVASVGAWFLSGHIYRWLLQVADESSPKDHTE